MPQAIAFDGEERSFGNAATSLAIKRSKTTYFWALRLIGENVDSPAIQPFKNIGLPYEFVELPDRNGAVGIKVCFG